MSTVCLQFVPYSYTFYDLNIFFSYLRFILKISWSIWSLRADWMFIFFIERSNHATSERFIWVIVKWNETKAVNKIILGKNSIIYSLKFCVKIDWILEIFFLRSTPDMTMARISKSIESIRLWGIKLSRSSFTGTFRNYTNLVRFWWFG